MVPELSAGRKVEPSAGLFPQLQVDHSLLLKDTKERVNSNGKTQMLFSCDMTFFLPNPAGFFNTADFCSTHDSEMRR